MSNLIPCKMLVKRQEKHIERLQTENAILKTNYNELRNAYKDKSKENAVLQRRVDSCESQLESAKEFVSYYRNELADAIKRLQKAEKQAAELEIENEILTYKAERIFATVTQEHVSAEVARLEITEKYPDLNITDENDRQKYLLALGTLNITTPLLSLINTIVTNENDNPIPDNADIAAG